MPADTIAIVGATGAVGCEALSILLARGIPASRIRVMASARSAGETVEYGAERLLIEAADDADFSGCAAALFCADADTARRLAPRAIDAGATVIDNSSAFRLEPGVPLVVPEINGHLLTGPTVVSEIPCCSEPSLKVGLPMEGDCRDIGRLIANPNCSTIILLCAIEPLRRAFGVSAIDLATYQAVSGAGVAAIDELLNQTQDVLEGREPRPRIFTEPCAFNLFSHDSAVNQADGLNGEERKIIEESRKILAQPTLRITPTCVRVPAIRAHTQAITVTLDRPATEAQVRAAIAQHAPGAGLTLIDDRAANSFPTPRKATGTDRVLIGRVRPDPGEASGVCVSGGLGEPVAPTYRRWCLLASGDQIRKGAALNAIQIAEHLGLIRAADTASTEPTARPVEQHAALQPA